MANRLTLSNQINRAKSNGSEVIDEMLKESKQATENRLKDKIKESENGSIIKYDAGEKIPYHIYKRELEFLQNKLSEEYTIDDIFDISEKDRESVREDISNEIDRKKVAITESQRKEIKERLFNDILGLGALQKPIDDPLVEEIRVNHSKLVYVVIKGRKYKTDIEFVDEEQVFQIQDRIAQAVSRQVNKNNPICDARLKEGYRVHLLLKDVNLKGGSIVIRKFYPEPFTNEEMIQMKSLNPDMVKIINGAIEGRLNILVAGGTASGKTSTLNWLSRMIPDDERVITIEDSAELKLSMEDWVPLETKQGTPDNPKGVTTVDLLKGSLRMSPDRIIVGECRDGMVAMTMLGAMNTGHEGSMSTIHSNGPRDTLMRLEQLMTLSGIDASEKSIKQFISSSIDLIIFQAKMKDKSRKITYITEILGMEGDVILAQDIYVYKQDGYNKETNELTGTFMPTGVMPRFLKKLEENDIKMPRNIFSK